MRKEYDRFAYERPATEPNSEAAKPPVGPLAKPHPKEYVRRFEVPLAETDQASSDLATATGPASQAKRNTQPTI